MIEVYTWATPNGHKIHIALEEMGLPYEIKPVNVGIGEQFKPEFLAITPNHRIPAIVDNDGPGHRRIALFESGAILIYLAEKSGMLIPKDAIERFHCFQWLFFQVGGIGPMFGQYGVFTKIAPEKIPYAIERYTNEVRRLHSVLDKRLSETAYLAGAEYSIADIASFPWIRNSQRRNIDLNDYPNVKRWHDAIAERPAVKVGGTFLEERRHHGPIDDVERDNLYGSTQYKAR